MEDSMDPNDEEMALMATVVWFLSTEGLVGSMRVREVWPKTSPWRWAPPVRS